MGGGGMGCLDGDGASRLGPGRERPWGRVARGFIGSKVKSSEWWKFGVEWLLGAANGDEPKRTSYRIKKESRGERIGLCAARKVFFITTDSGRSSENEREGPGAIPARRSCVSVARPLVKSLDLLPGFGRTLEQQANQF